MSIVLVDKKGLTFMNKLRKMFDKALNAIALFSYFLSIICFLLMCTYQLTPLSESHTFRLFFAIITLLCALSFLAEWEKRALTDHMTMHRQLWQNSDPGTNALLGIPPPPPIPGSPTGDLMMMTGGMGAGAPGAQQQGGAPPPQGKPPSGQPPVAEGDPTQAGGQPTQPQPAQPPQGMQ